MKATAIAHPNIALVKYWGKRDARLNLPATGSLSLTLGPVHTRTTVTWGADQDSFCLDGVEQGDQETSRIARFLDRVREKIPGIAGARVESRNDFPTAAGLASSSSGFAALALAATSAAGLQLESTELSVLARLGSGSAARSVFGGFAQMHRGARDDGADAFASPLFDDEHWPLSVVVGVTTEARKETPSTEGMNHTQRTSPYFDAWVAAVDPAVSSVIEAIRGRDFDRLALLAEASAMQMHASAIAAVPGVLYWNATTVDLIHAVRAMRTRDGVPVFFTIDAGPHVKVFTLRADEEEVARRVAEVPGVLRTIVTRPAGGARLVETDD